MRLPVIDEDVNKIDDETFCKMIDSYMEQGFKYFDTAYPYHNGNSEQALKRCLVERYDRDAYFLADKMPLWFARETADYQKIFDIQLERLGVDYFDFYLLHAMNKERLTETEEKGGFEFVKEKEGGGKNPPHRFFLP